MASFTESTDTLFSTIQNTGKQNIILLFDVSGSVIGQKKNEKKVIEIMVATIFKRLRSMGIKYFKCIFFGSKNQLKMPTGYVIDESLSTLTNESGFLELATSHADLYNLTCPHFAIDNIPKEWLTTKSLETTVKIIMVGDGELYDGSQDKRTIKQETSRSITRLLDENPLVQFSIHTVDVIHIFGSENMAGMDVYDILKDNKLTHRITDFVLFTSLEDGRELFSNKIVPPGFIGFRNQMFNITRENEFFAHISNEITRQRDESIYDMVRYTSMSIASIIKARGLSTNLANNLIYSYANLFRLFQPEPDVDIICEDLISSFTRSVKNILSNQAELSTSFATDRKKFFEEASGFLSKSVKEAIGTTSLNGCSFPINNILYGVKMTSVISPLTREMPYACYADANGTTTPILPEVRRNGKMTNQCMRQYVRMCMQTIHGFKNQSDHAKFAPLVYMTMAYFSDIPVEIKFIYTELSICMLQKTLTGIDITELEHLRKGNTHTSKNWVNELQEVVNKLTGTTVPARAVWFVICNILNGQLNDTILSQNQLVHVKQDVPNPDRWMDICATFPKLKFEIINTDDYEYICPFTHENTSAGGFGILAHPWNKSSSTSQCSPKMVIANDPELLGMLFTNDHFNCPTCRARLPRNQLEYTQKSETTTCLPVKEKEICGVVILKGPVGSGKTTVTKKLVEMLSSRGKVHVVSNDMHCARLVKSGVNPKAVGGQASKLVSEELASFIIQTGTKFVIVDICNEKHKDGTIFGISMPTTIWTYSTLYVNINPDTIPKPMFNNYFAWCLLHVLSRTESGMGDNYWLNPESAGFIVCKKVLTDKVNALFPGKMNLPQFNTMEEAFEKLTPMSKNYDEYLKTDYNQMAEIEKCLAKFM
jgi:hypothetical protein